MIRTLWTVVNAVAATAVTGGVAILGGLFRVRRLEYYDWCAQTWARWILWGSGCEVRVEGLEHVDLESPQVLVGNHQSWFDVPAVAARLPKSFHFVAKKELERVPLFGPAWKAAGHISIDRSDRESAIRSLELAGRQLRNEGSAVIIFPEGTRAPSDALQPFKKGAFMLAAQTGVPIVPFAVAGSRRVLPRDRWRVRRGPIIVRFGEPIPTEGVSYTQRDGLVERVRGEVRRLLHEGRSELGPGTLESPPEGPPLMSDPDT